jgi:engulfment/cell motility protein 1
MATSFGTTEHYLTLCLRDEEDHLVTQSTLASKVLNEATLKWVTILLIAHH